MDTNAPKTPEPLPFAAWRSLGPAAAAREFARRALALPLPLRDAAFAWAPTEEGLAAALAAAPADAPLRGVPYLLKDLFDVVGLPTRAGSPFLAAVRPVERDSALVARLRELGAALAGKTHLVEFAAGLTGENRTFGDCPHPTAPGRLAGGSSSGSAALVAAGVAPFAIGTDTGGSIRVPAAFCGVYGYRGAPGDAFIRDAFPLSPTCDTAGWFTSRADDLLEVCDALLGPVAPAAARPRGVALRAADLWPGAIVDAACTEAAQRLAPLADRATVAGLLASWRDATDAYATLVAHEAHGIHRAWLGPHRSAYDPTIWQRLEAAAGFDAARLDGARAVRERVRREFDAFLAAHDFLVLPCAPFPALTKAQCTPEARRAMLTFTAPASLAGLPVLTLPVRLADGLTAGLQVVARDPNSPVFRWALRGR